ncbi:MAG: FAD-linked oxidase C-terminal domain-containing protein, partial [Deltaproteobacteria bacterium]
RRRALFAVREAVPEAVNGRVAEVRRNGNPGVSKAASDVIVPFDKLTEAMTAYRAAMSERGLDHAVWGHVSDGNLHPNMIATNDAEMESARDCQLELGRIAIRLGGSPMSEHGTGRNPVKQVLLGELYGKRGMAEMRAVKDAFDPHGILSPGVMLPAAGKTSE